MSEYKTWKHMCIYLFHSPTQFKKYDITYLVNIIVSYILK